MSMMPSPGPLFGSMNTGTKPTREDRQEARQSADRAVDRVERGADMDERSVLHAAACTVIRRGQPFTTQDIWAEIGGRGAITKSDPRVMGAVMRRLASQDLCHATDQTRPSGDKTNHNCPLRVWMPGPKPVG